MFFTPELLERRESGFGLLWLAATLGAKSSFKKLPKRSVLTADISQLCGLIAQPPEPLALRLSSNLMMGVARVYKVKQEILYSDVTICYNTLKKAVTDLYTASLGAAELQAGQASLRPDVLTLVADPGAVFAIDFGNVFGDWDESRIIASGRAESDEEDDGDDEFNPTARKSKGKQKAREKPPSLLSENIRANLHTLDEHHDHLLSQSFDASFSGAGFDGALSAQMETGFQFSDDVFGMHGGMGLGDGDIGDELAKELGEGWGAPVNRGEEDPFALGQHDGLGIDFQFEPGQAFGAGPGTDTTPSVRPRARGNEDDGIHPDGSIIVPLLPLTPIQDGDAEMQPNPDDPLQAVSQPKPQRKAKRVRLLLDARTELTDEELKAARANYLEGQEAIRQELIHKKFEKESGRIIEELIWGVPSGLQAPVLADFWMEHFKLQVDARSVAVDAQPPHKRRRIAHEEFQEGNPLEGDFGGPAYAADGLDADMGFNMGNEPAAFDGDYDSRIRSSEEPGVARRASRAPSLIGSQFELPGIGQDFASGSQRSALFPWDNAGASSSVGGAPLGSARGSIGRADTRLRGGSLSSRNASPLPGGRVLESPANFGGRGSLSGEGFEFDVPGEESMANESQLSDMNVLTLERNSYNFLEYAKMQLKTFPGPTSTLTFDDVVPKQTSTPHVAAAAFYHCLVLATKDMVQVAQAVPYGTLRITVK